MQITILRIFWKHTTENRELGGSSYTSTRWCGYNIVTVTINGKDYVDLNFTDDKYIEYIEVKEEDFNLYLGNKVGL